MTAERVKEEVKSILRRLKSLQDEITTLSGDVVLTTDTDTTGWGFVIDEDDMRSDLDTKVPTQQSVKAYVDALAIDYTQTFLLMGA